MGADPTGLRVSQSRCKTFSVSEKETTQAPNPLQGAAGAGTRQPRAPAGAPGPPRPRSEPRRGQSSRSGAPPPPTRKVPPPPRRQGRLALTLSPVHHLLRAPPGHRLHGGAIPPAQPRDRAQLPGRAAARPLTLPSRQRRPGPSRPSRRRARPAAAPPPGPRPARPRRPRVRESAGNKVPEVPAPAGPEREAAIGEPPASSPESFGGGSV